MRIATVLFLGAVCAAVSPACVASTIPSGQVSNIVTFGDSLSDGGNASIFTLGTLPGSGYYYRSVPGVPFQVGEYTNAQTAGGPAGLWIDQFAAKAGLPDPLPALAGGTNFAVGSATTGAGLPNMGYQVGLFLSTNSASPSSLYTFWGGGDDILGGGNPITAADNIKNEILSVAQAGGKDFLWLNLPGLGSVPELSGNTPGQIAANLAAQAFDAEWLTDLNSLDGLGINVVGVDVNSLFNQILSDPAAFGFSDVTHACMVTAGCNPNTFLYWDGLHPTSYADSLVATLAFKDAFGGPAPTPEPPSWTMLGVAAVGLLLLRRRILPV